MLRFLKVSGDSLSPEFCEGDFVLISKIPFCLDSLRPGDVIVFDHPVYGILIKRIAQALPGDAYLVVGSHEFSVDSRQFGPVSKSTILGKVIWHIARPTR
jgi:nickel-type superoxide dismutase maturation protease